MNASSESPRNDTPSSPEVVFTDWPLTPDNSIPNSQGNTPARVTSVSPYPTPTPAQRQNSDLGRNLPSSPLLPIVASSEYVHPSAPQGDSPSVSQPHRPVKRKIPRPILPFSDGQARVLAPNSDTSGTASQSLFNSQSQQVAFSQPESTFPPDQGNLRGDIFLQEAPIEGSVQDYEFSQSLREPHLKNDVRPPTRKHPTLNLDDSDDDIELIDLPEERNLAGRVSEMLEIKLPKDTPQSISGSMNEPYDDINADKPAATLIPQNLHIPEAWAEPSFLLQRNATREITAGSADLESETGEIQNEVSKPVVSSKLGGIIFDDIVVDEDLPWMNLLEFRGVISRVCRERGSQMML